MDNPPLRAREVSVEPALVSVRPAPVVPDAVELVPVLLLDRLDVAEVVPVVSDLVSDVDRLDSLCVLGSLRPAVDDASPVGDVDVVPVVPDAVLRVPVSLVPAVPPVVAEVEVPAVLECVPPLIDDELRRVRSELIAGQFASSSVPDHDCVPALIAVPAVL